VIVDNEDSLQDGGVKFNTDKVSTWRSNRDKFNLAGFGTGFAYGNSTHDTSHVGSSFTFRFSGEFHFSFRNFLYSKTTLTVTYRHGSSNIRHLRLLQPW